MITIICVGKIKEKYIKIGIEDYIKRIKKYTNIEIIEIEDESFDKIKTLKIEAEKIEKKLNKKSFIITLEIDGKQLNSVELSNLINNSITKYSDITFVIGGSYGLDDSIKQLSNYKLSFSNMTFPHQLFRLIFLEQLFGMIVLLLILLLLTILD